MWYTLKACFGHPRLLHEKGIPNYYYQSLRILLLYETLEDLTIVIVIDNLIKPTLQNISISLIFNCNSQKDVLPIFHRSDRKYVYLQAIPPFLMPSTIRIILLINVQMKKKTFGGILLIL